MDFKRGIEKVLFCNFASSDFKLLFLPCVYTRALTLTKHNQKQRAKIAEIEISKTLSNLTGTDESNFQSLDCIAMYCKNEKLINFFFCMLFVFLSKTLCLSKNDDIYKHSLGVCTRLCKHNGFVRIVQVFGVVYTTFCVKYVTNVNMRIMQVCTRFCVRFRIFCKNTTCKTQTNKNLLCVGIDHLSSVTVSRLCLFE